MNLVYFCFSSLYNVLLGIVLSSLKLNIYVYIQSDDCGILIRSSRSDIWTKSLNSGCFKTCTFNLTTNIIITKNLTFQIPISQLSQFLRYTIFLIAIYLSEFKKTDNMICMFLMLLLNPYP